jgi:hypothetical protein
VSLFGTIHAELRYDPIGFGERLFLDGRLILTTSAHGGNLVQPRVDFFLEAFEHAVPARIDVKASILFFKTYAFRLTIAGKTVYEEASEATFRQDMG